MENSLEQIRLCLDIVGEVKKQIPEENRQDIFEVYAANVQSYAKQIQNELTEELQEHIRNYKRIVTASFGTSVQGKVAPEVYHLNRTCTKYGLNEKELFEYFYNQDWNGVSDTLLRQICYTEAFDFARLFDAFNALTVWKNVALTFPKDGDEYGKLKYALNIARIKEAADEALQGCKACLKKETLADITVRIELFLAEAFQKDVKVPQKSFPVYNGKAKLLGSIFGAIAGGVVGGAAGFIILTDLIMGLSVIGAGLGLLAGFLIGRGIANKKENAIGVQREKIEKENKKIATEAFENYQKQFSCRTLEELLRNKDSLVQVFGILGDACRRVLSLGEFSFLPADYRYNADALEEFVKYYDNKRVNSIKEAVNLYIATMDAQRRQQEFERLQQALMEEERRRNEMLQRNQQEQAQLLKQVKKTMDAFYAKERETKERQEKMLRDLQKEADLAQIELNRAQREAENEQFKTELEIEKLRKELGR